MSTLQMQESDARWESHRTTGHTAAVGCSPQDDAGSMEVPTGSAWLRRRRAGRQLGTSIAASFHSFPLAPRVARRLRGAVVLLLTLVPATTLWARSPAVRFDTADLIGCRDVTTEEFATANPHERLVEAQLRVTATRSDGISNKDAEYLYRFSSPAGRLRVVDYRPRTRQATLLAGNVTVEKKRETNKSLGLNVTGSFENLVRGTAGTDVGSKNGSNIRYELKPPMEAVLVAGTIERGTGVYFKLRSAPDQPLEGSREFKVVLRVPESWRGDLMYVRCEALDLRHGKPISQGVARFVVGLYIEGDDSARIAAEELVLLEAELRHTVSQRRKAIQRQAMPSLVHKVGALLDVYDPRIPDTWLDQVIYGSTDVDQSDFYGYLPEDVRRVADRYRRAKRRMYQLSGSRLAMSRASRMNG